MSSTTDVLTSDTAGVETKHDAIQAVAQTVENYNATQAFQQVEALISAGNQSHIELGGVLSAIESNEFYSEKSYSSFSEYLSKGVAEEFGFEERTARYLIATYRSLVDNEIPWGKVEHLGWTKLRYLAPVLTKANVDSWVDKAGAMTVQQIIAAVKAAKAAGNLDAPPETSGETPKSLSFTLFPEQKERVELAVEHAMQAANTESKGTALDAICLNYLEGAQPVAHQKTVKDQITELGYEEALNLVAAVYPDIDISVSVPDGTPDPGED